MFSSDFHYSIGIALMLVTTLSKKLFEEYGLSTVKTWSVNTEQTIILVVSSDEMDYFKSVLSDCYTILTFSKESENYMSLIADREKKLGVRTDDYRWQASRFSWKIFALEEAFKAFKYEKEVTWLDADTLIKRNFDNWLIKIFSQEHAVSFLGRTHKQMHAETGLINFRGTAGFKIFSKVSNIYKTLELYDYNEWHDAYIYTSVLLYSRECYDICAHNNVRSSNPLLELDGGKHIVHLKGERKRSILPFMDSIRVLLRK